MASQENKRGEWNRRTRRTENVRPGKEKGKVNLKMKEDEDGDGTTDIDTEQWDALLTGRAEQIRCVMQVVSRDIN